MWVRPDDSVATFSGQPSRQPFLRGGMPEDIFSAPMRQGHDEVRAGFLCSLNRSGNLNCVNPVDFRKRFLDSAVRAVGEVDERETDALRHDFQREAQRVIHCGNRCSRVPYASLLLHS